MLGGQDWLFASPSFWHHGGGALVRCLVAYSYMVYKSEESSQPLARRRKRRIQMKDWWNFSGCSISSSDGHFRSPIFVLVSHSHSSSFLSQFWIMYSRVWLEGNAAGTCKSSEGFWHRGKQYRTSNEKPVSISKQAAAAAGGLGSLCVWGLDWVFRESGPWPLHPQAMSKMPKNKNVSWVSTASLAGRRGGGFERGW